MKKLLLTLVVLLSLGLQLAMGQSRPVKGQVLDDKGEGVPGASVQIKGTKTGTITDAEGNFSLDVPDDDNTLVIKAVGFTAIEVAAGDGDQTLDVRLSSSNQVLGETVITALGIKKEKKALGYSVSEVSADQIEKSGERNAIQSLSAKAPGVQVISSAGTPGASSKILIRGNSTFTGNNAPLVVVDGIPIDNSTSQPTGADNPFNANLTGVNEANRALDINPDDIESVSVLKGPAAAALYGASGGNGAIIITTKKGKYGKGQGLGITFTSSVELNKVSKLPKKQNIYAQGNGGVFSTGNTANSWGPRMDTAGLPSYNNYDNFYQTGVGFNNTLSLNGGNENTIFRASVGNYTTKGIIPNSKLERTNVTLNAETKLASWLTVGGSANYSHTESRMVQNGSNTSGPTLSLFRMPASYDITKNYYDPILHTGDNYNRAYDNPLFTVNRNPYNSYTNRILGNTYFNADILPELKLTYKIGVDAYGNETKQIYDLGSKGNSAADGSGQINKSTTNYMQIYSDLILRYNKTFGDFGFGLMGGYNYWYSETRYNFMRGSGLTVPNVYNLGVATDLYASNTDAFNRSQAFFGELNLSYKSFLYFNATARNEWNTAFGKNSKSFFYPTANLSWIFSEHIPANDILSYGKLRLALSKAGIPPSLYSDRNYYLQPFITDGNTNGNGFPYLGQVGYMPGNVNLPGGLRPETVSGKEIGMELRLWKNRISVEATYYNQTSNDLLLQKPVAPSSGYVAEYINAGKMRNKGVELALNIDIVKTKDWTVNVGGNWSKNISEVLALDNGVSEISIESGFTGIGSFAIVGEPYGVFYGTAWKRNAAGQMLIDADGYPIVVEGKNIGNPNPDWLMGLSGNFSYKGLSLSMLWDIRKGGQLWNGTGARLNTVGISEASADREHDYVVAGVYDEGTPNAGQTNTTAIPALDYFQYVKGDGGGAAENAIEDGGWIRLRSIGLSYRYTFNSKASSANPFKYVEVGVTGRNLFLHTNYSGVDPETSLTGAGSNIGGWDYFNNPGAKSYIFNLKFGL
jgi:TonB-linked SusC/RagA family outer membrane protein